MKEEYSRNRKQFDQWKGSRLRCILLSGLERNSLNQILLDLICANKFNITVELVDDYICYPNGFKEFDEVRLGQTNKLLSPSIRKSLNFWWLGKHYNTSREKDTPNWDIACEAKISGADGLILVEAKAHKNEMQNNGSGADPLGSLVHIKEALKEANYWLNDQVSGFNLSHKEHYQISNRFAWSWKLASLGIPVILIYLGFLNTYEMRSKQIFHNHFDWVNCIKEY